MRKLSEQIKQKELEIEFKKSLLEHDVHCLRNYVATPKFILGGLLSSVVAGYLIVAGAAGRSWRKLLILPVAFRRVYRQFKSFIPLLIG